MRRRFSLLGKKGSVRTLLDELDQNHDGVIDLVEVSTHLYTLVPSMDHEYQRLCGLSARLK